MPQLLLHIGGGVVVHQEHGGVSVPEIVGVAHPQPGGHTSPLHGPLDHALGDPREEVMARNLPSAMPSFRIFLMWASSFAHQGFVQVNQPLCRSSAARTGPALVVSVTLYWQFRDVQVLPAHRQGFPQAHTRHGHDLQDQGKGSGNLAQAAPGNLSRSCRVKGVWFV